MISSLTTLKRPLANRRRRSTRGDVLEANLSICDGQDHSYNSVRKSRLMYLHLTYRDNIYNGWGTVNRRYKLRAPLPTYRQTNYQGPDREMGRPQLDTETGKHEVDREKDGIPPLRDLAVVRHQLGVDIRLLPQRTSKVHSDRFPEV